MHPLDAIMQYFRGGQNAPGAGQPAVAASAAPAAQPSALDWLTHLHNLMAPYSGGLLQHQAQYSNDPASAPTGFSWADIARQAQADAQKRQK